MTWLYFLPRPFIFVIFGGGRIDFIEVGPSHVSERVFSVTFIVLVELPSWHLLAFTFVFEKPV